MNPDLNKQIENKTSTHLQVSLNPLDKTRPCKCNMGSQSEKLELVVLIEFTLPFFIYALFGQYPPLFKFSFAFQAPHNEQPHHFLCNILFEIRFPPETQSGQMQQGTPISADKTLVLPSKLTTTKLPHFWPCKVYLQQVKIAAKQLQQLKKNFFSYQDLLMYYLSTEEYNPFIFYYPFKADY